MLAEFLPQLPLLIVVILIASLIQGAVGFGFGLFAVAALSLFVPLKLSTPLLALLNVPVIFYVLWRLRHAVVWSGLGPIIGSLLVGIPFGIYVLVTWRQDILLRVLGVVLIASAIRAAWPNGNGDGARPGGQTTLGGKLLAVFVGLTTGALAGAFNTGGPPVIAYVYCRPGTKEERTATLQAVFAISVLFRILVMAAPPARLYHVPVILTALACLPGAVIGMVAGHAIFRRVPPRVLEIVVAAFLLLIALKLLIWP